MPKTRRLDLREPFENSSSEKIEQGAGWPPSAITIVSPRSTADSELWRLDFRELTETPIVIKKAIFDPRIKADSEQAKLYVRDPNWRLKTCDTAISESAKKRKRNRSPTHEESGYHQIQDARDGLQSYSFQVKEDDVNVPGTFGTGNLWQVVDDVAMKVEEDISQTIGSTSVRPIAASVDQPRSTTQKILRKVLRYYPYKLFLVQQVLPDDLDNRKSFALRFLARV
ncbi:hypothetical protein TNCV_3122101 [Trichonephila clavipes]|nr:hypothetical protein TNCV_3122101 [Trichonephila clavipes]